MIIAASWMEFKVYISHMEDIAVQVMDMEVTIMDMDTLILTITLTDIAIVVKQK